MMRLKKFTLKKSLSVTGKVEIIREIEKLEYLQDLSFFIKSNLLWNPQTIWDNEVQL